MTITPAALDSVEPPADGADDDTWSRFFTGTKRDTFGVRVDIVGVQYGDGAIERTISVHATDIHLDAATARDLGAALLAAAEELDQLDTNPEPPRPCSLPRELLLQLNTDDGEADTAEPPPTCRGF